MGDARADLFCEDRGHEEFVTALVKRLRTEAQFPLHLNTISSAGGKGSALKELKAYQKALAQSHLGRALPDLLVVVIDANCASWQSVRSEIIDAVDREVFFNVVVGSPEPHVERWCIADPQGFREATGVEPPSDPHKCQKDLYKKLLRDTIRSAGLPILTDEMEFAPDIVRCMDLFRAGRNQASLKHFIDDLQATLMRLKQQPDA